MNYSTPGGFKDTLSPDNFGCPEKFTKMLALSKCGSQAEQKTHTL